MTSSCLWPAFWRVTSLPRKYLSHDGELPATLVPFFVHQWLLTSWLGTLEPKNSQGPSHVRETSSELHLYL